MFDPALAIQNAMTAEERTAFLANFTKINPHWRGAHVADVLDELANRDAHLSAIEPMQEAHGHEVEAKGLITCAVLAVAYLNDGVVEWATVKELSDRVTATIKG